MNHQALVLTLASAISLSLVGCGKELGRVPFSAEGSAEATATLAAGDVDLWTDLVLEYKGDASLEYKVELLQDGKSVASTTCNPLGQINVKVNWIETNLGDSHTRKGSGKMSCTVKLPSGGPTTIKATFAVAHAPTSITVTKADLVVKQ